jgi:hypothetical protein
VQRGDGVVVDGHLHDRARILVELDRVDRPDGAPADPHLVALDELARVLERGRDLVAAPAAAEHEQGNENDSTDDPGERDPSREPVIWLGLWGQVRSGVNRRRPRS